MVLATYNVLIIQLIKASFLWIMKRTIDNVKRKEELLEKLLETLDSLNVKQSKEMIYTRMLLTGVSTLLQPARSKEITTNAWKYQ